MEENKWISRLKAHWKKGAYTLLIIACVAIWSERFYSRRHGRSSQDYLVMRQLFDRFKQARPIAAESLERAELLVKRHPELHASYDAMLAHCFFASGKPELAAIYTSASQKRGASLVHPHYAQFARATTLIAEGKTEEAYQEAISLEQSIAGEDDFQQLRGFNLLRLVFLAEHVGDAHEQWQSLFQSHASYPVIASLFQQGDVSLDTFLAQYSNDCLFCEGDSE